jgi:hypothetical protein
MDPLTAFAAAGNVLQFVQLGATLINKSIEYATDGGNSEYQRLQPVVQQLLVSNAHLSDALAQNTTAPISTPGPARAVQLANLQCLEVSRDFVSFLNESKLTKPGLSWRNGMLRVYSLLVPLLEGSKTSLLTRLTIEQYGVH